MASSPSPAEAGPRVRPPMLEMPRIIAALAVLMPVLAFAALVWPTAYRYDHITQGGNSLPVRINRFTGRTEVLRGTSGWITVKGTGGAGSTEDQLILPAAALAQLECTLTVPRESYETLITADIYNGTDRPLEQVVVELSVRDPTHKQVLRRQYALHATYAAPLASSQFLATAGFRLEQDQTFEWRLISARWSR